MEKNVELEVTDNIQEVEGEGTEKTMEEEDEMKKISPQEKEFARAVLEAEEKLFRDEEGSLGWQIVQLYRTFVLNLLAVFIINPVYRSLGMLIVSILVGHTSS